MPDQLLISPFIRECAQFVWDCRRAVFKVRQRADCSAQICYSPWIVAKVPKIHDDTFSSLLDRIGILREELISIERSLERMKDSESKRRRDLPTKLRTEQGQIAT